jgi:mRNA interferase RelE/StbE
MLDPQVHKRIVRFLEERVAPDPYRSAEPLSGPLRGHWRYRVGDYRIMCDIKRDVLTVLVVRVGHRREICRG